MVHIDKAEELLGQEYHCSQTISGVFAEEFGFNKKNVMKISTCFGAGMNHGGVCGCITSAMLVLGMAFGFTDPQDKELEAYSAKKAEEFYRRFCEKMNGKVLCRDILEADISNPDELVRIRQEGLVHKVCPNVIKMSIGILEDILKEHEEDPLYLRINPENMQEMNEKEMVFKRVDVLHAFRRNVHELLVASGEKIAFVQFDIRRFKIINDLYGEKFGDEILLFVKENLKRLCNDRQFYLNPSGDIFMVVTEYNEEQTLMDFIRQIENALTSFKKVKLQLTFGVYSVEDKNMEIRQMEDRAAIARVAAKKNVLTNVLFYQEQFKELLYTRKFIEENMHTAVEEKQFQMYLQPKYSISQNRIVGAEALVRWKHPERGMVYPNEFIPIMEENGFIKIVDYYIWNEACRFIRKCSDIGITDCPISVNVSRHHLGDMEFMEVLAEDIKENHIDKSLLELEITETVNDLQISQMAMQLKAGGFTLLMDDFGSGYSSLNVLLETPFDVIKLDKKFMDNMMASEKGKLILEYVVSMAEKLGLGLLAEGVETKEQVELLRKIGCDKVQGYYFAKPMPQEDFFEFLKKERKVG